MGLREINALRTRRLILDSAMDLFFQDGYEKTTVDDVAAHADVSTTTLYRYFPTKEELVVGYLGDPSYVAEELSKRPVDEALDVALGAALVAFVASANEDIARGKKFAQILMTNARPRARFLEWLRETQELLTVALARRAGVEENDLQVAALAWMAIFVFLRAGDEIGLGSQVGDAEKAAVVIMQKLSEGPLLVPRVALR